jgi:putative peptidoglycan lipid II flippase
VVEIVYQRGRFTAADTVEVALLLQIFALAVPAWTTQQIAVRAFYARRDTWRPMLLGTLVALAAVPLYLGLGARYGALGIAAAGVIGMSVNAVLTLLLARRLHGAPALGALCSTGARAAAIAAFAAIAAHEALARLALGAGPIADLAVGGAIFAAITLAGVGLAGDEAMREAVGRVARRLRRSRPRG